MFNQEQLPYLLQKEHIAQLQKDSILIGDRRTFPFERSFVRCHDITSVADAIRAMVTQGGGPLQVALVSMKFLARQIARSIVPCTIETFDEAIRILSKARPTNTTMARTLTSFGVKLTAIEFEKRTIVEIVDNLVHMIEIDFDRQYDLMSDFGSSVITDQDGILTTCFAEHSFLLSLLKAKDQGKRFKVFVPETRPYLQGARLTAPSLVELGIETALVTDGMAGHLMANKIVNRYMTAADAVAMDGSIANKIGTLTNAVCALHFQIPYHAFAVSPDTSLHSCDDIVVELRDGNDIKRVMGTPITVEQVQGYYPAFDVIDATLITSIITGKGMFAPNQITHAYDEVT